MYQATVPQQVPPLCFPIGNIHFFLFEVRKVRAPHGERLGNAQKSKGLESATENIPPEMVRVKRRGKSSPHMWRHRWHCKPPLEQDQILGHPMYCPVVDRLRVVVTLLLDRWLHKQNPAYDMPFLFL